MTGNALGLALGVPHNIHSPILGKLVPYAAPVLPLLQYALTKREVRNRQ
jgi:hypothetical protein